MPTLTAPGADRATRTAAAGLTLVEASRPIPAPPPAPPRADPPSYLAPKRARRAYGDKGVRAAVVALPAAAPGAQRTISASIQAMLNAHALDWAKTQRENCRVYLLSETGRFQQWCAAEELLTIDQLTTEKVLEFLALMSDRDRGPGLKASSITKLRTHLRSLARFQATTPGFGASLFDIDRIPKPRMPREQFAPALSREEEAHIVASCVTTRDRLVIEFFLATGVRVSEMAAVVLPNVFLTARPPRVVVAGSVHDPDCTKNGKPRTVTFRKSYATLARRLVDWIRTERDPRRLSPYQELVLTSTEGHRRVRVPEPLGLWGYERLCDRISLRAGLHFSPHVLRHTWATRLVDAGVKPIHLMEAGGWSSIDMVRRYYSANDQEVLSAIANAPA
jgi:integrase